MTKQDIWNSNLLAKFDLITAERIAAYLKLRIYELEEQNARRTIAFGDDTDNMVWSARIIELRELMVHINGDLNSMMNDMENMSRKV